MPQAATQAGASVARPKCGGGVGFLRHPHPLTEISSLHEAVGQSLLEALTGEVAGGLDELVDVAEQITQEAEGALLADDALDGTEIDAHVVLLGGCGPESSEAEVWVG